MQKQYISELRYMKCNAIDYQKVVPLEQGSNKENKQNDIQQIDELETGHT